MQHWQPEREHMTVPPLLLFPKGAQAISQISFNKKPVKKENCLGAYP